MNQEILVMYIPSFISRFFCFCFLLLPSLQFLALYIICLYSRWSIFFPLSCVLIVDSFCQSKDVSWFQNTTFEIASLELWSRLQPPPIVQESLTNINIMPNLCLFVQSPKFLLLHWFQSRFPRLHTSPVPVVHTWLIPQHVVHPHCS